MCERSAEIYAASAGILSPSAGISNLLKIKWAVQYIWTALSIIVLVVMLE